MPRIVSGDARLRDLEHIYTEQQIVPGSKHARPKTAKKPHQSAEMPSQFVQRTLVADTLDRL